MSLRIPLTLALILALITPLAALAQDEGDFVELSETQQDLNDAGVKAAIDGDFKTAVSRFESSNALQANNITYLNLGRAYYKLGRCQRARAAFDAVPDAPKVRKPTPEEIATLLERYTTDLEDCVEVEVAGSGDGNGDGSDTPKPPPEPATDVLGILGYSSLGVGAALLVTFAVVDGVVLAGDFDDFDAANSAGDVETATQLKSDIESLQGINMGLLIGGGVLVATGATLVIVSLLDDEDTEAQTHLISPWASQGSAGLLYRARF